MPHTPETHVKKPRNSNIEMLRIICMAMILLLHFVGATFGLPTHVQLFTGDPTAIAKATLEAFAIVGVNCFVLISGYYGIKATWRGAVSFLSMCLFASLTVYIAQCVECGGLAKGLGESFLILSHTDLWFVPAYFALYLLSPILNAGFAALQGRRLHVMLVIMVFLNIYLGWMFGGRINPTGYNVIHLIFIYFVGYYLRSQRTILCRLRPRTYFAIYIAMVCATTLSLDYAYNNPLVVASSVALFMTFATMRERHNRLTNAVASSVFMVYLLHKTPFIWVKIKHALLTSEASNSDIVFVLQAAALFVAIFVVSILVDKIRQYIFGRIQKTLHHVSNNDARKYKTN